MSREELEKLVVTLEEEMYVAAEELRFEYAAKLRDEIKELRRELTALAEASQRSDALGRRACAGTSRRSTTSSRPRPRTRSRGRAPVRAQGQRLAEAVEGERGRVRARGRRGRRTITSRLLAELVTTAPPRDREVEAASASPRREALREAACRARTRPPL